MRSYIKQMSSELLVRDLELIRDFKRIILIINRAAKIFNDLSLPNYKISWV